MPNNSFVGEGFFAKLLAAMENRAYKFITQVTISDQDVPYHLPSKSARVTSFFFKVRMRQFIVQLTLIEWVDPEDKLFQWWRIHFHYDLKPPQELLRIMQERLTEKYDRAVTFDSDEWREYESSIPFAGPVQDDLIENFRYYGDGVFEQINSQHEWETPLDLASKVHSVWEKVTDYVGESGRIPRYQVSSVPPHYSFPGSEQIFWERFGRENIHKLFKKAWGSDFPAAFHIDGQGHAVQPIHS
jgi:hypothetical protein